LAAVDSLELLKVEMHMLWPPDQRGRIDERVLVLVSSHSGLTVALGRDVRAAVEREIEQLIGAAAAPVDVDEPPLVLERCRLLLEPSMGPLVLAPGCGPSYLVSEDIQFSSPLPIVRSDEPAAAARLSSARPSNWTADEWPLLLSDALGPWAMVLLDDEVVSICHTPVQSDEAAEAGTWTRSDARGRGYAAAATAAWAAIFRPSRRLLFYSASRHNRSSQHVAERLNLRKLGYLWQLTAPK
jgi:RimJ/RimL family protein N-acetyltransferase